MGRVRPTPRNRMISNLASNFSRGLKALNEEFRSDPYEEVKQDANGFLMEVTWAKTVEFDDYPANILISNGRLKECRKLKLQVTVVGTEIDPSSVEIDSTGFRVGYSNESEGEHVLYIHSKNRVDGWHGITNEVEKRYNEAKKSNPEWPEIVNYDIGEWFGTTLYTSGPVPVEALVLVHDLINGQS